jgi:hypothetical protein
LGWRQANPLAPLNLISDQALRDYAFSNNAIVGTALHCVEIQQFINNLFPFVRFEVRDFPRRRYVIGDAQRLLEIWKIQLRGTDNKFDEDYKLSDYSRIERWEKRQKQNKLEPWWVRLQ